MNVSDVVSRVEASDDFKVWRRENPKAFLAHIFVMTEVKGEFQAGYFDGSLMKTFLVVGEKIQGLPVDEILQTEHGVLPLSVQNAVVSFEDAERLAREQLVFHYSKELALKTFFIVQTLPIGTVFNVTFFCQSMRTVNIKLSSRDGSVVKHSCESLIDKI